VGARPATRPARRPSVPRNVVAGLLLLLAAALPYSAVVRCDFVNYDDPQYVTANGPVRAGLTPAGLRWAATTTDMILWHPVTWVSHMLDVELHGLNPAGHHLTSVLLHVANVVLVFVVLLRFTGKAMPSLLAAALFGLHPLRVESVAWIAERKDVLSLFFALLGLWAYARYAERPAPGRMAVVAACLALGLMAKPTLVTFPFLLLLLDYWPLRRIRRGGADGTGGPATARIVGRLVAEKLPLFALAAAVVLATLATAGRAAAIGEAEMFPLGLRLENAVHSVVVYLARTVWPRDLAVFYPYPRAFAWWNILIAATLLAATTAGVISLRRRRPYLAVGWAWFLGTLVPVIGIVQTGSQAMADRYTYLPHVGLFVAVAWSARELAARSRTHARVTAALAVGTLVALGAATHRQTLVWTDSRTLFEHAISVTEDNWLAHNNLGDVLVKEGRLEAAAAHFESALRAFPAYADAHYNLAVARSRMGHTAEAVAHYREALRLEPGNANARNNLGMALLQTGAVDDAVRELTELVRVRPDPGTRANLALALGKAGRHAEAAEQLRLVLAAMPQFAEGHYLLAEALSALGRRQEAEEHYAAARALKPDLARTGRP
jgi:Flp pilus assembly protein TadD